jgi:serine/threonine protein kinase
MSVCLPEHQAAFYTLCIADALAFMHDKIKLVYRDLKPENIMIDAQGYPKLIDMGYAKILTPETDNKTFTFVGTPRYLAPEAVASAGSSFGVDHWALGILVYEMLTGENPFYYEGLGDTSLFQSIAEDSYPVLPETVSTEASRLIVGLLTKDPSQRLGSGSENDILQHAWLQTMDLATLRRKQVAAPWIPQVKDALDTSCFDNWDDLQDRVTQAHPRLTAKEAALFENF